MRLGGLCQPLRDLPSNKVSGSLAAHTGLETATAPRPQVFRNARRRIVSNQFPGRTERAREQLARFGIVQNVLTLNVPSDLAADEHRNQAQVAGNRRMMRGFDGCDRRFT